MANEALKYVNNLLLSKEFQPLNKTLMGEILQRRYFLPPIVERAFKLKP